MAWLTRFKLGRPGYEVPFDILPAGLDISERQVSVRQRNMVGDLKKGVIKTSIPVIKVNQKAIPFEQRNQLASLVSVCDTFLSFRCRDDWRVYLEKNTPDSINLVTIKRTSATKLSTALVAAGFSSCISVQGVYDNPAGTGTNFYTGGSYSDATRVVTLGSALADTDPVYVTYDYEGWLVDVKSFDFKVRESYGDNAAYDLTMEGV